MKKINLFVSTLIFTFIISINCFAGQFISDAYGVKYDVGGGRYLENGWAWCDALGVGIGYCYYFSPSGYMLTNAAAPDGSIVDALGRWTVNGIEQTKILEQNGYELVTAGYNPDPTPFPGSSFPSPTPLTPDMGVTNISNSGPLANRLYNLSSARVTSFSLGENTYADAIEFTEGYLPQVTFNSGANTKLKFHLTGDDISDEADFYLDVYVSGAWQRRIHQRFIQAHPYTITFSPYQEVTLMITQINDYYDRYIRRVYLYDGYFE